MRNRFSVDYAFKSNLKRDNITIAITPVIAFMSDLDEMSIAFMWGPLEVDLNYHYNRRKYGE